MKLLSKVSYKILSCYCKRDRSSSLIDIKIKGSPRQTSLTAPPEPEIWTFLAASGERNGIAFESLYRSVGKSPFYQLAQTSDELPRRCSRYVYSHDSK